MEFVPPPYGPSTPLRAADRGPHTLLPSPSRLVRVGAEAKWSIPRRGDTPRLRSRRAKSVARHRHRADCREGEASVVLQTFVSVGGATHTATPLPPPSCPDLVRASTLFVSAARTTHRTFVAPARLCGRATWMTGTSPMGWTPPPDGIAMCQGGGCSSRPEGGGIHGRG